MKHYLFRSMTDKLAEHIEHIIESGDTVIDRTHVGGRDWVLLCRKGAPTVADLTEEQLVAAIVRAVKQATLAIRHEADRRVRS